MKELNKINIGETYYDYIRYGVINYILTDKEFVVGDLIHFVDNDFSEIIDDEKNVFEITHIEENHVGLLNNFKVVSIRRLRRRF